MTAALDPVRTGRAPDERVNWRSSAAFFFVQLLGLIGLSLVNQHHSTKLYWILALTFWGRMFAITGGYHRYFSHHTFELNRFWQFVLGFMGTTAAQKGPLWWAGWHRLHHVHPDQPQDIHSPTQKGFWWSHMGWIVCDKYKATQPLKDFDHYPELQWLNRRDWVGPWSLGAVCTLIGGWAGLWTFFASTLLLWHFTFAINSVTHVFGRQRYQTGDTSKNNWVLGIINLGEGWHNNHHHYWGTARQGFFWWEIDITYYILWALSKVHVVHNLHKLPLAAREDRRPHPIRRAA